MMWSDPSPELALSEACDAAPCLLRIPNGKHWHVAIFGWAYSGEHVAVDAHVTALVALAQQAHYRAPVWGQMYIMPTDTKRLRYAAASRVQEHHQRPSR
jgi:hypothetical protein